MQRLLVSFTISYETALAAGPQGPCTWTLLQPVPLRLLYSTQSLLLPPEGLTTRFCNSYSSVNTAANSAGWLLYLIGQAVDQAAQAARLRGSAAMYRRSNRPIKFLWEHKGNLCSGRCDPWRQSRKLKRRLLSSARQAASEANKMQSIADNFMEGT
jgi:hypothetical protein